MENHDYLIGLALVQQNERRIMPIGGKSLKEPISNNESLNETIFGGIALEILLRLMYRTEEAPIQRKYGESSLLLASLPIEALQKELPVIKKVWIDYGDSENFLQNLKKISTRVWSITYVRYEGIKYKEI